MDFSWSLTFALILLTGRLESPADLVRKMASTIALVFSKVVDPKNPLYLDDSCCNGETIDWEFGLTTSEKGSLSVSKAEKQIDETGMSTSATLSKDLERAADGGKGSGVKSKSKKSSEFSLVDPDEIIDPATLNYESVSNENDDDDDDASENSDSCDSSLQPYDLTDDDTDLKRKISQLVDVVGALRKSDDADGVSGLSSPFILFFTKMIQYAVSMRYIFDMQYEDSSGKNC